MVSNKALDLPIAIIKTLMEISPEGRARLLDIGYGITIGENLKRDNPNPSRKMLEARETGAKGE